MTLYHYTYYSYEEFGRGYIGKRSCDCKPEEDVKYFGSYKDKTFKPTQKIILETYDTPTEAIVAEIKLQHFFKVVPNPHFANQAYQTSTKFQGNSETAKKANASRTPEQRSESARKRQANKTPEQRSEAVRKANASRTPEQRSEAIRKVWTSMTLEQRSEAARKANLSRTPEQRSEAIRKGWASRTPEQRSKGARVTSSQKWQCTQTGHISNAGGLSHYQRARGIDTSNRVRLS
jgi:hypothetical protein